MNISAKELAKLINVSPATVSMVFNNKPGISDATRELVLKTAAEYGYAPKKNEASGASSRIIQLVNYKKHGKVAADTPFFSQLTEGISTECTRQGCALHISYFYETMDIDSQLDALRAVDCEGILLLATEMAPSDFRKFRDFSVPIVVVDCYYDELDYDCVLINNIQGAFNATNYLIQCGHKNVGYFHSSLDISNFSERADGYYKALRANGISTSHPYVHPVSPTSDEGYLRENGYRIPEDVSIIGFDDVPMCDMMVPPLSTMKVRKRELGATAVQRLLDRVADPKRECLKMCMATKLVKRQSVSRR